MCQFMCKQNIISYSSSFHKSCLWTESWFWHKRKIELCWKRFGFSTKLCIFAEQLSRLALSTTIQYSLFGSILSVGAIVGALWSGRLADLIGRRGVSFTFFLFFINLSIPVFKFTWDFWWYCCIFYNRQCGFLMSFASSGGFWLDSHRFFPFFYPRHFGY